MGKNKKRIREKGEFLDLGGRVYPEFDENINVIIKSSDLTDEDVAKVLEVVVSQTNAEPANVIIIPVEG